MKQFKLTLVLTMLMSMVGLQAFAAWNTSTKVQVDGLYYYLDNDNLQAQVTSMPFGKYTGDIMIPSTFTTYNETNYSVTSIGKDAFSGCTGLTSITIPNSVTSIGTSAFSGCSKLTSIALNSNAIVSKAYTYDDNIKNIFGTQVTEYVIGDDVTAIGENAFSNCSSLTSVTIGSGVTTIGNQAFRDCSGLTKVIISDIAAWCGISFSNSGNPLSCARHLYSDENTEITDLVIPDGVSSINDYAFSGCSGLTSIDIPNSVTSIGQYAFNSCSGLTSVTIGNSVTSIGKGAFYWCSALTSVTIPNSVTSIGNEAFEGCSHLTSVTIPNSVTSIGQFAFSGCTGLTSVTIPNSVTSINSSAFSGCSGLTSIIVASGNTKYDSRNNCNAIIETASNRLLYGCKKTTIPNSVTSIGNDAFSYCFGLTSVTIPNSVTSIGKGAFYYCSGLTSITIPNSVTSIGQYAFYYCSGLTSVTIPNSVTSIGYGAFSSCSGLTSVTIPNSVTSIGERAFYECIGLTSVTIGNRVKSIGEAAFYGCFKLTSVTALKPTPVAITQYEFTNRTNATLNVPKGSKGAYQAANYWKEFKEIVEIDPTGIDQISFQENGEQGIDQEGAVWYTIDGKRVDKPKKGINIIRMSDGTTKKVVVK